MLKSLPPELAYLVEPAMKYGSADFDPTAFRASLSDHEYRELVQVSVRFYDMDHAELLDTFLDQFPMPQHELSAKLYFLLGVLDGLGLKITKRHKTSEEFLVELNRFGGEREVSKRSFAARMLGDGGVDSPNVINALLMACKDKDERVQVWAHYGLVKLKFQIRENTQKILDLLSRHNNRDEFGLFDDVGSEAEEALNCLGVLPA